MKKLLILSFLAIFSHFTYAGSGKAIVPYWSASASASTDIRVSNITTHPIIVKVTFFDRSGNELAPSSYVNFQNGNTQVAPKATGQVRISSSSSKFGYAVIEWENEQDQNDAVALVAHGVYQVIESSRRTNASISINNGLPF